MQHDESRMTQIFMFFLVALAPLFGFVCKECKLFYIHTPNMIYVKYLNIELTSVKALASQRAHSQSSSSPSSPDTP